jgi:hypothetical protein
MPKRKRKRTRIRPGPILVVGLIVVLISGIMYSPLTSLSRATVIGAKPMDRPLIDGILANLNRIPWTQVNGRWIETHVQRIQGVERANYSQNIFGRGRLEVTYRTPVARVRGEKPIGMDLKGVMFETDTLPETLPLVVRPQSGKDVTVALASGFAAGKVADLAVQARQMEPKEKLTIWFNRDGALCLNIGSGLVILGSCDDLDVKLRSLKEILEQQPDLLGRLVSLNLTEPTRPAKTYKKQRE